jgi:putative addiction module component (TIGR02574 family)
MVMTLSADEIRRLPVEKRLELIGQLWDSLQGDPQLLPLTPAQQAELERWLT